MNDQAKPFLEHLEDFRIMLVKCIAALVAGVCVCLLFIHQILEILKYPLIRVAGLHHASIDQFLFAYTPMGPFNIILQTGLIAGLILALPFVFFFIGQFLLPALTPRERRMLVPAFTAGGALFLAGVAFCYFFILPQALNYMIDLGDWIGIRSNWPLDQYLGFVVQMLAGFGLSFELPLLIIILAKLGIVSKAFLARYRRHAFVVLLVFSGCMVPDVFSMLAMTLPLYALYEISIFCVAWIERERARNEDLNSA